MASRTIRWNIAAVSPFQSAIEYIANDSLHHAEKVRSEILETIARVADHPELYPPDKFKRNNNGNFRAFELHRLRISFFASETEVRILRIRHTSRQPKEY